MSEQWTQWIPMNGLSSKYDIESIIDDLEGFFILLTDTKNTNAKIKVSFENSVDAHRSINQNFKPNIIDFLNKQYGEKFCTEWTFFKVTNSSYLQWLSDQSYTWSDHLSFIHFAFIGTNLILDVVNSGEPKVELITVP